MDLFQNPFHILSATPRDNRGKISDLADERRLLLNSSGCTQACSVLTNPGKRLSAEISWLPELSPKNAEKIVTWLSKPVQAIPSSTLDSLSPMARANFLASGLQKLARYNSNNVAQWVLPLAWAFEETDPEELCAVINEERIVSGFPEVTDLSAVEAEIQERRSHYKQAIKSALDNLSAKELVEAVTVVVKSATDDGESQGPILIDDMVDSYEVEAQGFLEKEEGNITALVDRIRKTLDLHQCPKCGHIQPEQDECLKCGIIFHKYIKLEGGDTGISDDVLSPLISQLIQVVKNWDTVAQPIQVSTKSRGLNHEASRRIAALVRGLAMHLFNEHSKLNLSQQLTNMLQEVFAEVGEVAELITEDTIALNEIAQRVCLIEDAKNQTEEWRREITYETNVGFLKPDKLRISPEGIEWKGRRWDLDSITGIRWGGTRHSVNGIPTGATYNIGFGNSSGYSSIRLKKQKIYSNVIDRLWRAVGVRILTDLLKDLCEGKQYRFGTAIISDYGMELEKFRWIGDNERVFCRWDELVIWSGAGVFCIGKKEDKKLSANFSYQDEDNIHVLEAAIRMLLKRGGDRLSSLLGD